MSFWSKEALVPVQPQDWDEQEQLAAWNQEELREMFDDEPVVEEAFDVDAYYRWWLAQQPTAARGERSVERT